MLNNKMITNSYEPPFHKYYSKNEEEQEKKDFFEWCDKTKFMKYEKIKNINVLYKYDLLIEWKNGAILNNFIEENEFPNYYFYDDVNNKVYDIYFNKILQWNSTPKNE